MNPLVKFLIRLILFLSPIASVFFFSIYVLHKSRELEATNYPLIASMVKTSEFLYGPAYSDCMNSKLSTMISLQPKIIVLGSSRAHQIRSDFFKESFYNAWNIVRPAIHLKPFLEKLPIQYRPSIIVLVFDQAMLNPKTGLAGLKSLGTFDNRLSLSCPTQKDLLLGWNKICRDFIDRKFSVSQIQNPSYPQGIGLRSRLKNEGTRADGSEKLSKIRPPFEDSFKNMEIGYKDFEYGDQVSEELVQLVSDFLAESKKLGIHVVAYLPPYAPSLYRRMMDSGNYKYISKEYKILEPIFSANGHTISDYTNINKSLGITDKGFLDGIHPSERVHAKILLDLSRKDSKLASALNKNKIQKMLSNSKDLLYLISDNN